MAEQSGIFPSVNGDRKYFTSFFAAYFADFISNGIYPNPSTQCQVLANNDMTVTLKPGNAYINGYKYINDSDKSLTIETADGVLKRIDRIVLRHTTLNREIKAYVKKGTFASTPVAPSLQRDADMWELGVADIYVANGAVSISQANITDLRLNNSFCGIVHCVIDKLDTTTLFNQYQAWISEKQTQFNSSLVDYAAGKQIEIDQLKSDFQTEFTDFMSLIQGALSGDVAGNLLVKINENTAAISQNAEGITDNSEAISDLDTRLDLHERVLTATIPTTGWSGSAPYSVAVTVTGLSDSRPIINPVYSAALATKILEKEAWNKVSEIDCTTNTMSVYCFEEKPTIAINVELKGA